jgi:hypothetical protein
MQWLPQRKAACPLLLPLRSQHRRRHRSQHRRRHRSQHPSRHRASSQARGPMRVVVRLSRPLRQLLPLMHPHRQRPSRCLSAVSPYHRLQVVRCRPAARSFRRRPARLALNRVPTRAPVVVRAVTPRDPLALPELPAQVAAPVVLVVLVVVRVVDQATGPAANAGPHVAPVAAGVVAIKTICNRRQCSTRRQTYLYPTASLSSSAASRRRSSVPS